MTSTLVVKLNPVSSRIRVPILNGELDLDELVKQHSALLSSFVGKDGLIYLGVLYDLKPNPDDFDPNKTNIRNGRHNLPLTVYYGENGPHPRVADADFEGIKEFLKQRAELEQQSEGATRPYGPFVNAIFYQAE